MSADDSATYTLGEFEGHPFIRCTFCDLRSFLAMDLMNKYCPRCHLFHRAVMDARKLVADGMTHECSDWPTARDVCAVCGAPSRWLAGR